MTNGLLFQPGVKIETFRCSPQDTCVRRGNLRTDAVFRQNINLHHDRLSRDCRLPVVAAAPP
jgi:hypothetical protein